MSFSKSFFSTSPKAFAKEFSTEGAAILALTTASTNHTPFRDLLARANGTPRNYTMKVLQVTLAILKPDLYMRETAREVLLSPLCFKIQMSLFSGCEDNDKGEQFFNSQENCDEIYSSEGTGILYRTQR